MSQIKAGDDCTQCSHPFALHSVISPGHNPLEGGMVLCPVQGCPCYATWGVNGGPAPKVSPEDVVRYRTAVQTGEF